MLISFDLKSQQPQFGTKVPVKSLFETVSGRALQGENERKAEQIHLLTILPDRKLDLEKIDINKAIKNLGQILRDMQPSLKILGEHINARCRELTHLRTCEKATEAKISEEIAKLVKEEEFNFGIKEIDIPKINANDLLK